MKFYVLNHPEKGFLRSKKWYNCTWTDDIEKAKKWSFSNHAKNVISQTSRPELRKCKVWPVEYFIHSESLEEEPQMYGGRKITKDFNSLSVDYVHHLLNQ